VKLPMILRVVLWFVVGALAMGAAVWLAERPGTVSADWHGWRLETSVGVMLVVIVVMMTIATVVWLMWRWIAGAPGALLECWGESRRRQGYRALTQGLAAVAAGDGAEAQKHARKAESLLSEPALTLLLSAQAAHLAGDKSGAERAYRAMLEDEHTAVLGLRGLIGQALKDGDAAQALGHAERAFELRPQTAWVVHSLFDMQAQSGRFAEAQATLESGLRHKVVPAERGRTLKALLLVERSRSAEASAADSLARARDAFALAPERTAVSLRYAELALAGGDAKRAQRTLERAWTLAPHPDLVPLYLKAAGESDPLKRVAVVRRLVHGKEDDLEAHLALARVSIEAGLWGEARRHLMAAGGTAPATRACRMMAEVEERAGGDPARVREWLQRAAEAPADRAWRCHACGAHHETWHSVCGSCGAFGTLNWRAPGTFGQIIAPGTGDTGAPAAPAAPALTRS